jgi:Rrf2 family protein
MRLSTKARYAARALAELASADPGTTRSVRDLAARQAISPKYLEQILNALRAAGLVTTARGMHGGYTLARSPGTITLRELFEVLEGSLAPVSCVDDPNSCPRQNVCPTRQTWIELKQSIATVLERTTIQDLVERKKRKLASTALMYHI